MSLVDHGAGGVDFLYDLSEENKQRIKATAEGYNFVKIAVKLKVMLDKFHERLARQENICDWEKKGQVQLLRSSSP